MCFARSYNSLISSLIPHPSAPTQNVAEIRLSLSMQNLYPRSRKLPPFERPQPEFWVHTRKLIVQGRPDEAMRMIQQHSALNGAAGVQMEQLMMRLETLLEMCPRLSEPELMQALLSPLFPYTALASLPAVSIKAA